MNLLLIDPAELTDRGTVSLSDVRARHLRTVLHVQPGQELRVGLVDGPYGVGRVEAVDEAMVSLRCAFEAHAPSRPRVDVLLALPRPKVMRRLWAQLAALGVGQIILTNAGRVERNYFDTHMLEPREYGPLLIEGLQQARDTRVPAVSIHRQFRKLIEDDLDALCADAHRLVADPSAASSIGDTVRSAAPVRCLLAVGPEGGWNTFERDLLAAHGFHAVGMGARTLRSDTACVALVTLVHEAMKVGAVGSEVS
jgi:16S rRNA (uracil1498-N3)-methyltransferase